ncbi:MAG: murein biosynthesis integral membrane protein MurJ, partial [Nocardioides sp.]
MSSILRSGAVMAAGTAVSRLTGFLRSTLLVVALGGGLHADLFNIANTVPNMLYILLAGGVFNAVLVPQLIRTMKSDPDGGEAYAQRVVTAAMLFLGGATVLLVLTAPWLMGLLLDADYSSPGLSPHRESVIAFARFCLPQVFFYGMFVLVGQILNARGRFGPMMWAPIANNVVAVSVLGLYLYLFGQARGDDLCGPFTGSQEMLLGLGSTLGIVAQFAVLVPFLRAAGFHFRPRFDFRGVGLGHTLRLGLWTVGFVIVNQIAYAAVVRLASGGTTRGVTEMLGSCPTGGLSDYGTGYTVYSYAFLLVMVPHSIVTVSLATAMLPALSAQARDADHAALRRTLSETVRLVLTVIIPVAALLPVIAPALAKLVWGYGAARESYELFVPTLALFGVGLLAFTMHYLMLRGFYALELNREVFFIQIPVAAVNVIIAGWLVVETPAVDTAPALVVGYTAAYAVGSLLTYLSLRRRLGGLETGALARFLA